MNFPLYIHAANIGFMLMFMVVVAPAVFKVLSQKAAASFLRILFPRLFLFGVTTSGIATIFAVFNSQLQIAAISAIITIGFLFNTVILTPQINRFRDKTLNGDTGAKKIFERLHLLSVTIFVSQFSASLYLIILEVYFA